MKIQRFQLSPQTTTMKANSANNRLPGILGLVVFAALTAVTSAHAATLMVDYKAANFNASTGVWLDSSGNNDTATYNAGGGSKPTLQLSATPNGSSAVMFVNANSPVVLATPVDLTGASGFTIMTFALNNSGNNSIIGSNLTAGTLNWRFDQSGKQDALRQSVIDYGTGTATVPQGSFASFSISGTNGVANSGLYRLNGAADGTFNPSNAFTGSTNLVGGQSFFGGGWNGQIAEIQIYSGVLTTAEKQTVESNFIASYVTVPEPSTYAMVAGGFAMLIGLQGWRRRRN